jgi:hypothetical protein
MAEALHQPAPEEPRAARDKNALAAHLLPQLLRLRKNQIEIDNRKRRGHFISPVEWIA